MSKKTFYSIIWLLLGTGILVFSFIVITAQPQNRANSPVLKMYAHKNGVYFLAFTPDGRTLVSSGSSYKFWDSGTGRQKNQFPLPNASWLSPNGKYLALLNRGVVSSTIWIASPLRKGQKAKGRQVKLYARRSIFLRSADTNTLLKTLSLPDDTKEQQWSVGPIGFSDNSESLYSVMTRPGRRINDGRIETRKFFVWNLAAGKQTTPITPFHTGPDYLAGGCQSENLRLSNDGRKLYCLEVPLKNYIPQKGCVLRNELTGNTASLAVDNLIENPDNKTAFPPHWEPTALSPDNRQIAAVYKDNQIGRNGDGAIYLFDIGSRRYIWKYFMEEFNTMHMAFSPDGKMLACGGQYLGGDFITGYVSSGRLLILSTRDGKLIESYTTETWQDRLAQDHLKRTSVLDKLFISRSKSRALKYVPGDSGPVTSLTFSPDSKTLAVGYVDGSIKLWQLPQK